MRRSVEALLLAALLTALLAGARLAAAHEMSMAEMELRETAQHEFLWQWTAGGDKRPITEDLTPSWPEACAEGTYCDAGSCLACSASSTGVSPRLSE